MGRILLLITLFTPTFCWGQNFFPISVDPTRDYKVSGQDSIVDHFGEMLPIKAGLAVVNWGDDPYKMYDIKFAEGKKKGDTIVVRIHDTNTIFDYDYTLKIVKNKFSANFWYQTTIDSAVREVETLESKLILKTIKYKKGSVLVGYTEYKGRCVTDFDKNKIYVVRGSFKIRLE